MDSTNVSDVALNRPDIFPVTDLALQKGYSAFYKKKHLVDPKCVESF